jgi:hypothetical protein
MGSITGERFSSQARASCDGVAWYWWAIGDERAVGVRGVDEGHAPLDGVPEHPDGLVMVPGRPPDPWPGELHRPEAQPPDRRGSPEVEGLRRCGRGSAHVVLLAPVGEGSPVHLGTPALILDVELPEGGTVTTPVPPEFQGFAYLLEGEGAFGANLRPARPPQLVLLGPGEEFTVTDAAPGTRYMLMAGKPYGEAPVFNGPFVD